MTRAVTLSLLLPLVVFVGTTFVPTTVHEEIHLHAAFHLYRDGERVDLAMAQYMHDQPCSLDEHRELSTEEKQLEKAHLHDLVGDVVHVHRANATWGDLFQNLDIEFDGSVIGYTADGEIADVFNQPIKPLARVIISAGELTNIAEKLAAVPDQSKIREVEAQSESCGTNH